MLAVGEAGLALAAGGLAGGAALAGFAGFEVVGVGAAGGMSPPLAPPAAVSNAFRCVRNSPSFARMAGSRAALPDVPTG
jgi:hypothetical protein